MVSERRIKQIFRLTIYVKGFDALLECLAGIGLAWLNPNVILNSIMWLIQYQTARHPNDLVVTGLKSLAENFSMSAEKFFGLYLLAHGLVKLVFVIGLLRNRLWAYPFALVAMTIFIAYQLYRLSHTHSLPLLLFTLFDIVFVILVAHEYWQRRTRKSKPTRVQRAT